ncbi:MAG: AbrB/MazE/SpoVT family DNA-binding domain-containing protein [Nitrosopumilus sp.]|uniref:AbrB/MazE/SpoVT family DNA-binding domain-containing protein n=1 Tax=Nitrosopumilus sp. TaxID=2024843 RepID=UPI00246EAC4D|nr:AbrB/MazE/SpoVT family DNA-binding domain-containing protein [Nitrosopumilus sp.]MDH5431628.1 AbrB/MazE/SpoVT family DNA-binding domain-containing protein [Nitrosopumilus sp.]MDH5665829.1 AbrB/MazE/SpoVT family DNA-binding domain-containing protein [Nitrosopumilus sp.]MDH5697918.1 AbrB/MazE/SpoVT family DNA-binding domain-containing protein [Nitrosopumilus sp.]
MSGNQNLYDPSEMFKSWIQKSGRAQAEFMKNFGSLMTNQSGQTFNPLETLKGVSETARQTQSNMMNNMSTMQSKSMDTMFSIGQMLPSFMNWGAYKTTISSNGRISIPEAERNALGLGDGDLVQVIILPIAKKSKNKEVKQ